MRCFSVQKKYLAMDWPSLRKDVLKQEMVQRGLKDFQDFQECTFEIELQGTTRPQIRKNTQKYPATNLISPICLSRTRG